MTNMAIKTLLIAGVATFGLCTGALAQTNSGTNSSSSGATTQTTNTTQSNSALQLGFASGGDQSQRAYQRTGGGLVNLGVQATSQRQNVNAGSLAVQSNRATVVPVKVK
jgi:hypothetical protein